MQKLNFQSKELKKKKLLIKEKKEFTIKRSAPRKENQSLKFVHVPRQNGGITRS